MGQRRRGPSGRLAAVGSSAEVQKLVRPETRVVDAHGASGDAGLHRFARPFRQRRIWSDVRAVTGRQDAGGVRVAHQNVRGVDPPGTWILGGVWDHTTVGRRAAHAATGSTRSRRTIPCGSIGSTGTWAWPTRRARGGHVSTSTPEVAGGTIVRDAAGEPDGHPQGQRHVARDRVVPEHTTAAQDRRSMRRWPTSRRKVSRRSSTWATRGTTSRRSSAPTPQAA